jgi:predicted transcriptional regulator
MFLGSIGEYCNRELVTATRNMSIPEAAQLMRQQHVGDLVIVNEADGKRIPVGIVTDRDMVVEIIAKSLDLNDFCVGDIMSSQLVSVRNSQTVLDTIRLMHTKGVRRIPVVNLEGELEGIITADDILGMLAEEMAELAKISQCGKKSEAQIRM